MARRITRAMSAGCDGHWLTPAQPPHSTASSSASTGAPRSAAGRRRFEHAA